MTSLISRLIGQSGTSRRLTPEAVSKLIDDATQALSLLQGRYGGVAFKAEEGDPEGAAELAKLNQAIRDAEDRLRSLTATLTEAKRIEALEQAVARENLFDRQRMAVAAHLSRTKTAAEKIAEAEAMRAEGWRELITHVEKAKAACPIGFTWPPAWPSVHRLAALLQGETFRVGGEPLPIGRPSDKSLPGYVVPPGMVNQPDKIEPLASVVAKECDHVSAALKAHADAFKDRAPK